MEAIQNLLVKVHQMRHITLSATMTTTTTGLVQTETTMPENFSGDRDHLPFPVRCGVKMSCMKDVPGYASQAQLSEIMFIDELCSSIWTINGII